MSKDQIADVSKTLTEQWKKGELPSGFYYVYLKYLEMFDIAGRSTLSEILERGNEDNIEVLAEVPSYEEWQASYNCMFENEVLRLKNAQLKKWCEEFNSLEVAKENTKLKDLLKHLSKTQAKQFRDNQKLQVKAEHAKDVVNIDTARKIKQLKSLLKSALSWLPDGSKLRGMRYAQLQSIKRKINQVLGEE